MTKSCQINYESIEKNNNKGTHVLTVKSGSKRDFFLIVVVVVAVIVVVLVDVMLGTFVNKPRDFFGCGPLERFSNSTKDLVVVLSLFF